MGKMDWGFGGTVAEMLTNSKVVPLPMDCCDWSIGMNNDWVKELKEG